MLNRDVKMGQIGPQIGQIWDFLRSVSVQFQLAEQKYTETDLKKSRICPNLEPNLPSLDGARDQCHRVTCPCSTSVYLHLQLFSLTNYRITKFFFTKFTYFIRISKQIKISCLSRARGCRIGFHVREKKLT